MLRYIIGEHSGTGYLKQMSVFPLSHSVLLWSVNTRAYMNDTMFGQIRIKNGIKAVFSIIGFKDLNFALKLSGDH